MSTWGTCNWSRLAWGGAACVGEPCEPKSVLSTNLVDPRILQVVAVTRFAKDITMIQTRSAAPARRSHTDRSDD
jgi:hypothetical protein